MHEVEQWGRANGATLVALDTYIGSPLPVPFYEKRMGIEGRLGSSARHSASHMLTGRVPSACHSGHDACGSPRSTTDTPGRLTSAPSTQVRGSTNGKDGLSGPGA
jgi:hypothetical protein